MEVKFYDTVNDELLKFAVIISQSNGKWVFCKHKERDTYEVPGGHRETGENILETAKRELQEETGAVKYEIKPTCVYSVTGKTRVNDTGEGSFGMLYFAEITEFAKELHSEMEKVILMDEFPENWTYPLIQPKLIEKYLQIEKQSYSRIQLVAKQTIEYIKKIIKPGMNLLEIRKFCEEKLLELGADSFWYWDVGAFVFAGDETTVSVSGKQYVTSNRVIGNNDIITIDLSPQMGNIWGDYARTIINIYKHDGYMPDARSGNWNGRTQGGSNADIVIADAFAKGMKGIDYELALKAMIKDAEVPPTERLLSF